MNLVIDASIGVKWFKGENEKNVDLAIDIQRQKLQDKIELIIPDLFFYEVMNILISNTNFDLKDLQLSLDTLIHLNMDVIYPDREIISDSINISKSANLSFYDSLYIAIAKLQKAILLTDDKKMLDNKLDYDFVKSLDEFTIK